jgi:hypothetical protein
VQWSNQQQTLAGIEAGYGKTRQAVEKTTGDADLLEIP